MASSYHGGFILGAQSVLATDTALHSAYAKSLIANNLLHAADYSGQMRVCMMPRAGTYATFRSSPVVDTYYKIMQFGPFPVTIGSGTPTMRWRLAGHSQTGAQVTFKIVWAPSTVSGNAAKNATTISTTSTTAAWLFSAGLEFDVAQIDANTIQQGTKETVGGNAVSVFWVRSYVTVWAKTASAACQARLDGLFCTEHCPL